ncbi:MAG: hypothetical protein GY790_03745 [Bacteroidetes bacterium]|nr:hypothetical protein [Bacteroidota bacterium]
MEELFSYGRQGIKKFFRKNLNSILYTLIFHLVVLIVLLFSRVEVMKRGLEIGINLEFQEKTVEDFLDKEEIDVSAEWLEEVMRQREAASNRAVNVNAEDQFSQDISTDDYVNDLLDQIEQARNQEDREKLEELQAILASADYVPPAEESDDEEQGEFTGPTTITYEFIDEPLQRKKVDLTIPVYRCQGSGLVRVAITVAPDGTVLNSEIKGAIEGTDKVCFADAALSAARSSLFRIDISAPAKQRAIVTYSFVAQ